jgi:nucleotide-binding universal stress UspA family protein
MKPAEREAGIKNMLFGGTDMQLFRMCPCPVWVFKPTHNTELRKILIAVDLLAYDREKSALADNVLQWGKHVADLVDAELHVVHVWDLYGEATIRGRSILADTADKLVQEEEQKHRQWLNEALEKNGIEQKEIKVHFYKGEAKKLIPEIANAMETDLLVMGTVGRTGIPGFFIGNTADSVLRQVDCSVLAIKPEGFVTPVKVD